MRGGLWSAIRCQLDGFYYHCRVSFAVVPVFLLFFAVAFSFFAVFDAVEQTDAQHPSLETWLETTCGLCFDVPSGTGCFVQIKHIVQLDVTHRR